jgi:malonyl-CoA/methylmalonyl-CoA synthetase
MALPISTLDRWKKLSLHTLLERYGMSELGMGVTNPYRGQRVPGSIGFPFPGVRVRVNIKKQDEYDNEESPQPDTTTAAADPSNQATSPPTQPLSPTTFAIFPSEEEQSSKSLHDHHIYDDEIGELLIQGDNVFTYYFNRPDATKESFIDIPQLGPNTSPDGSAYDPRWFKTGDIARIDGKDNRISLLGRNSADILKIAGFKVSALQIERAILEHPGVATTAVVGLPSESTGQSIAALIVPNKSWAQQQNNGKALDFDALSAFLSTLLGKYKLPREVIFVDDIPVNAMGKINKKHLSKMLMEMPEIAESKWRK